MKFSLDPLVDPDALTNEGAQPDHPGGQRSGGAEERSHLRK